MDAFPPLLRLCERGLPMCARLLEDAMRCRPMNRRCLPFIFGCSIMMASEGGVPGEGFTSPWSTTTESMDSGSMARRGCAVRGARR
jgi:hypothetical protein